MPQFVKTDRDEKAWARAKEAVVAQYGDIEKKDPEKFFSLTTAIYKNMCKNKKCTPFKKDVHSSARGEKTMRELIDSIERRYMSEGIDSSGITENGKIRIRKSPNYVEVTDLTNAGKRGKNVKVFKVFGVSDKFFGELTRAKDYDDALSSSKMYLSLQGRREDIEQWETKGISVSSGKKSLSGKGVSISFDNTGFMIQNETDVDIPTLSPPMRRSKEAIQKFLNFMSDESIQKRLSSMTFSDIRNEMAKRGIDYRFYLAMD